MKTQFLLSHTHLFKITPLYFLPSPVPGNLASVLCVYEFDSSVSSCRGNWCFTGLCYLAWCHQGPPRGALSQNSLPFRGCICHCVYRPCFLSPSIYQQALRLPLITIAMDISLQIFLRSCFRSFDHTPSSRIAGLCGNPIFNSLRRLHALLWILHIPQRSLGSRLGPQLLPLTGAEAWRGGT